MARLSKQPWQNRRRAPARGVPTRIKRWLNLPGSMTQALTILGQPPAVTLRHQTAHGRIWPDEIRLLGRRSGPGWVREVILHQHGHRVLIARSVAMAPALRQSVQLRTLGPRPLGLWLFAPAHQARPVVSQTARLRPAHPLLRQSLALSLPGLKPPAWARRTVYRLRGGRLIVTELLLPALWQHLPSTAWHAHQAATRQDAA